MNERMRNSKDEVQKYDKPREQRNKKKQKKQEERGNEKQQR